MIYIKRNLSYNRLNDVIPETIGELFNLQEL